jgi:hypothetical protein
MGVDTNIEGIRGVRDEVGGGDEYEKTSSYNMKTNKSICDVIRTQ